MDYFEMIEALYYLQSINKLTTEQICLWYALLYIDFSRAWEKCFVVNDLTLESLTRLSREDISKARSVLKQKGYIDFVPCEHRFSYCINDITVQLCKNLPF